MAIEMRRRILFHGLFLLILVIGGVRANVILCGEELTDTLNRICHYGYRRNLGLNSIPDRSHELSFEERSLLDRVRFGSGVLSLNEACCDKSCAMEELMQYCVDKPVP
ncbi:probable insulin-like peptide 3 [Drosophila kikkawai]|uniref:Probable insulin-like peptide 3 n=1 Tax=Drosophila kikkawai TaxID=30033 RepID=A0A6P4J273_DROKI|nr:probable insulin-like peptide 3 [Drosophila kikkawai]